MFDICVRVIAIILIIAYTGVAVWAICITPYIWASIGAGIGLIGGSILIGLFISSIAIVVFKIIVVLLIIAAIADFIG